MISPTAAPPLARPPAHRHSRPVAALAVSPETLREAIRELELWAEMHEAVEDEFCRNRAVEIRTIVENLRKCGKVD